MRNTVFFFFGLLIFGCAQNRVPKPSPFMEQEQMVNFLVDLSIANAARSHKNVPFVPMDSLYAYHGIDSIIFAKNNVYYAAKPKIYTKIYKEVEEQIEDLMVPDSIRQRIPTQLRE